MLLCMSVWSVVVFVGGVACVCDCVSCSLCLLLVVVIVVMCV